MAVISSGGRDPWPFRFLNHQPRVPSPRLFGFLGVLALALGACSNPPQRLAWETAPATALDLTALGCVAANLPLASATRSAQASDLAALGVSQVRWELIWRDTERQKGVYDFASIDSALDALDAVTVAAGRPKIEPIVSLGYGNTLYSVEGARNNDTYYPPDDPADYAHWAAAAVTHLLGRVGTFEIWNEENAGYRFWKPAADPAGYSKLFEAASASIRAACPACKVMLGAPVTLAYPTVPAGPQFLKDVLAARPLHPDAAGVHPYMLYPPCSAPEGGPNRCGIWTHPDETPVAEQITSVATAASSTPYVTEIGWPSFLPPTKHDEVTPALQASWLLRAYLLSAQAGARSFCWWTWSDDARTGQFPPEGDFGLVKPDGSHKPAFDAYAALLAAVRPARLVRDRAAELGLKAGEHALLFSGAAADTLLTFLWREEDVAARAVSVTLHATGQVVLPGQLRPDSIPFGGTVAGLTLGTWPLALVEVKGK